MKRIVLLNFILWSYIQITAQIPSEYAKSAIDLQFKKLESTASVLYIAAHPDDENTRLISWLANEKCVRTGYLSLTRGDGGQNLIGSEQGIELGVIRTQELLAARRTDGGEQFFTRAYDFGYSKTPKETFEKWTHEEILSDVVYVIRKFRPDVIITRFATDGSGGHGHHTASAILAEEAFDAAADPKRFPEQLKSVSIWQAKRLLYNSAARFWNPNADMSGFIKVDVGGFNQELGKNYGEIAAESRSMHKSQGFGSAKQRGEIFEYFKPIKGDTAALISIFDRIDLGWNHLENGKKIAALIKAAKLAYQKEDLNTCNKKLLEALSFYPANGNYDKVFKRNQLIKTLLKVNSVFLEAIAEGSATPAIGDTLKVKVFGLNRSQTPIILNKLSMQGNVPGNDCSSNNMNLSINSVLKNNVPFTKNINDVICLKTPLSKLYWLNEDISENKFVTQQEQIGKAYELSSGYQVVFDLNILGEAISITESVQYKWTNPEKGELYRPLVIVPPVSINLNSQSLIATDSNAREIKVSVKAGRDSIKGLLVVYTSSDWKIYLKGDEKKPQYSGASTYVEFAKKGEEKELTFFVKGPNEANIGVLDFSLVEMPKPVEEIREDGLETVTDQPNDFDSYPNYTCGLKEITYDHIPTQVLFPKARVKLVKVDIKNKRQKIAYIPGAGDEVASCLTQLGYEVTMLSNDDLASSDLNQFAAIITGVRAYNTNEQLSLLKAKLMEYVNQGGNLIVQYNTNSFAGPFKGDIGPYPFKITRERITDENAAVNFTLPQHAVFNKPNKITEEDFKGWIQERSIYHGGDLDARYEMPITMNDPGEKPNNGALVIGKYGKGNFVYTGMAFFRELPAGVPGAYRLFVNLIELGK